MMYYNLFLDIIKATVHLLQILRGEQWVTTCKITSMCRPAVKPTKNVEKWLNKIK